MNTKNRNIILPILMTILIVTGMVAAADIFDNKEIIFPEIAAIAAGGLVAPKLAWNTDKKRILFFITVCAVLGVGIVRYVPGPVWMQMVSAYLLSQLICLCSGTTFAPMISAMVLPVMLQTETVIYIICAVLFTTLILFFRFLLEQTGATPAVLYTRGRLPGSSDFLHALIRTGLSAAVIFPALTLNAKFAVAPPLLVAFTEFSNPASGARKKPVKSVVLIGVSALIGASFRYVLSMSLFALPLCITAALTILAVLLLLERLSMFIPPAGAVSILAMLIPEQAVLWFPVQITIGAFIVMTMAILFFKKECPENC